MIERTNLLFDKLLYSVFNKDLFLRAFFLSGPLSSKILKQGTLNQRLMF